MKSAFRLLLSMMVVLTLPVGAACGGSSTPSTASHSSSGSSGTTSGSSGSSGSSEAQSTPSGAQLDPSVTMPNGFPSDIPIYRGARLTQQSQVKSNGRTTWGMQWETFDALEQVGKWYEAQFNQGDWTVTFSGSTNSSYSVTFARKSNANDGGLLGLSNDPGYTRINIVFELG